MFIKPEKLVELKQPTFCFNCCKFGHLNNNCQAKTTCRKCSLDHLTKDCTVVKENYKCINCNANHKSTSKSCLIYNNLVCKINNVKPKN